MVSAVVFEHVPAQALPIGFDPDARGAQSEDVAGVAGRRTSVAAHQQLLRARRCDQLKQTHQHRVVEAPVTSRIRDLPVLVAIWREQLW